MNAGGGVVVIFSSSLGGGAENSEVLLSFFDVCFSTIATSFTEESGRGAAT